MRQVSFALPTLRAIRSKGKSLLVTEGVRHCSGGGRPSFLEIVSEMFSRISSLWLKKANELLRPQTAEYSLGLHIGNQNIIMAEFECKKDAVTLCHLAHEKIGPARDQIPTILTRFFSKSGFSFQNVTVSLLCENAVSRIITFPFMEEKQLKASLAYEAEKYLPYNMSEIYFDCQPLYDKNQKAALKQIKVLLAAAKKEVITNLMQLMQKCQGKVDGINLDSLATLNAFLRWLPKSNQQSFALLDIGSRVSNLSLFEGNQLFFIRDISFGGVDLTEALVKNLRISVEEAEKIKTSPEANNPPYLEALRPAFDKIVHEVKVTLHYVEGQLAKVMNLKEIFLAGGISRAPFVQKSIQENLGLEPSYWDCLMGIKIAGNVDVQLIKDLELLLPVSVGLALGKE